MQSSSSPPAPGLRPARPQDAAALAALHLQVWRATYGQIAPPAAVAALDGARRLAQWQAALAAAPDRRRTLLAETPAGEVVGLVSFGAPEDPVFGGAGEIKHLYVAASQRGRGLGARLLRAAGAELAAAGYAEVALAVVEANLTARAFYRRQGGIEGAAFRDAGPLWRSENRVVRFAAGQFPTEGAADSTVPRRGC